MARGKNTPEQTVSLLRFAHWWALTHYVNDELLEIDNSAAERALCDVALGRKKPFLWIQLRRRTSGRDLLLGRLSQTERS